MSQALVLPFLVPLLTAVILMPLTGRLRAQRRVALASGGILLAAAAWILAPTVDGQILVLRLGGWDPSVGIVWAVDALGAVMLLVAAVSSLAVLVYLPASLRRAGEARYIYPLLQFLLVGVNGAFMTGDLFNLFVFFEIMLLASFALIALGGRRRQLLRSFPYVAVNLVSSALFLGGVGAVYGTAGTVNMAELSAATTDVDLPGSFWGAITLVLAIFMVKAALVPVFFWLPDSYAEAPIAVTGIFAALLTKVGVYTLFRVVPLVGGSTPGRLHDGLMILAAATMLVGVVGALGRSHIRGVLSFHIVSQVGYMIFGLAVLTPLALAAGIFHLTHNMLAKTALILSGGIAERVGGSGVLGRVRGLVSTHPWVAAGFIVPAMSLAGLPPFSGFWGKLFLVMGGFQAGAWVVATIALVVGFITLASMLKIWVIVFWGPPQGQRKPELGHDRGMVGATLGLAALTVVTGLLAAPIMGYLERAAAQVLHVSPYVEAVLSRVPAALVAGGGAE